VSESRIIQLPGDKRHFVVGMGWRHEDRPPSGKTLRAAAKDRGRWVCKRRTGMGSHQTGFSTLDVGKKKVSMQSLAALVADAKPEPWLGIFDLGNDLYWYIAVRDNQEILHDGDLIGGPEEIAKARERHASLGEWSYVDGATDDILKLIATSKASAPVFDSQARPWLAPAVGLSVAVAASFAGASLWHRHEARVELDQQMAMAKQRAIEQAMQARMPKPAPVLPWTQLASAADFLSACGNAFAQTPLAQDGWVLSSWACQQNPGGSGSVSLSWMRVGGNDLNTPAGTLTNNGDTVQGTAPLSNMLKPDSGPLLQRDPAERAIRSMAQSLALPLALSMTSPAAQPSAKTASDEGKTPPPPPWAIWTVGVEVPAPPWAFGMQGPSGAIPGLRWTRVNWDGSKWTLSGAMYVMFQSVPATPMRNNNGRGYASPVSDDPPEGGGFQPVAPATPMPSQQPGSLTGVVHVQ